MDFHAPISYWVDPEDPRAPPQEVWDRMSPEERARVVASLPSEFPLSEAAPPEGDVHQEPMLQAKLLLRRFFRRTGRSVYMGANLPVYYPGEAMFSPDVLAVADVDVHTRDSWIVSKEGKGLDWTLEVMVHGDRRKDLELNVKRYSRLGIREYFIFDRAALVLIGYRLPTADAQVYRPIEPVGGIYVSEVLGLELGVDGRRLRFWRQGEAVLELEEYADLLEQRLAWKEVTLHKLVRELDDKKLRVHEAEEQAQEANKQAREADKRAREAEERARAAEERAREAEAKLAELLAAQDDQGG